MGLTDDIALGERRVVVLALLAVIAGALDVAAGDLDRRLRVDPDTRRGARSASCRRFRRIFARPAPEAWWARRWC
jgi:hypothetical protein